MIAGVILPGSPPGAPTPQTSVWSGDIDNLEGADQITLSNWIGYLPLVVNYSQIIPPLQRRSVAIDPAAPQVHWELAPYPGAPQIRTAPMQRPCPYILGDTSPPATSETLTPVTQFLVSWQQTPTVPAPSAQVTFRSFGDFIKALPPPVDPLLNIYDVGAHTVFTTLEVQFTHCTTGGPGVGSAEMFPWLGNFANPGDYREELFIPPVGLADGTIFEAYDLRGCAEVRVGSVYPCTLDCKLYGAGYRPQRPN